MQISHAMYNIFNSRSKISIYYSRPHPSLRLQPVSHARLNLLHRIVSRG
jgi:hypothetical protein